MNHWQRRGLQHKLENEGAQYVHPDYPEWAIMLRRFSEWAPAYQRALVRIAAQPAVAAYLERTKAEDYQQPEEDRKLDAGMLRSAFAEGCVASWTVTGENDQPLLCTPENAVIVFKHFPEIYAGARAFAADAKNYGVISDTTKAAVAAGN